MMAHDKENRTIIIHGGPWKTGSTAIQIFLHENRKELLDSGIFYPNGLVEERAHHEIPELLNKRDFFPILNELNFEIEFIRILKEFSNINADTLLLSSENFSRVSSDSFKELKNVANNFGIKKFKYLRFDFQPGEVFQSNLSEKIRHGRWLSPSDERDMRDELVSIKEYLYRKDVDLKELGFEVFCFEYRKADPDEAIYQHALRVIDPNRRIKAESLKFPEGRPHSSLNEKDIRRLNQFNRINLNGKKIDKGLVYTKPTEFIIEKQRLQIAKLLMSEFRYGYLFINWVAKSRLIPKILRNERVRVLLRGLNQKITARK